MSRGISPPKTITVPWGFFFFFVFILHRSFEGKNSFLWNRTSNLLFQDDKLAVVAKNFSSWQTSSLACHACSSACEFGSITGSKFHAKSTQSDKSPFRKKPITPHCFPGLSSFETFTTVYFYSKTNKMHQFLKCIYFGIILYMFRTVFSSIIRSSRFYIYLLLYVQSWTPGDGRKDRLKHVEC